MKDYIISTAFIGTFLISLPFIFQDTARCEDQSDNTNCISDTYIYKWDNIMPIEEYIYRSMLYDMNGTLSEETAKALAVCERTYALYISCNDLGENDLKPILSDEEITQKFGSAAAEITADVICAERATRDIILTYEGKPLLAHCHPSSIMTESAADLFGTDIPYLVNVRTEDTNALRTRSFTSAELDARMKALFPDAEDYTGIEILSSTESGTVLTATVCGKELTGEFLSDVLTLNSPMFTVSEDNNITEFIIDGEGSHLGMSISGAELMSQKGADFKKILSFYYPGSELHCPQTEQ